MRQILIEKYIKPSKIIKKAGCFFELWVDEFEEVHSFMGQPACVYNNCWEITSKQWLKKGIQHRDKGLPSVIFYEKNIEVRKMWYKKGEFIKKEGY